MVRKGGKDSIKTLAPGTCNPPAGHLHCVNMPNKTVSGFTLIELLVVLLIVGIALGLVAMTIIPDQRSALREEAQRLALLLENAGLEARASGHSLGWSYSANGYRFWQKNEYGDWVLLSDSAFRPRTLPNGSYIQSVTIETQSLPAGETMLLSAASFPLPFSIRLRNEQASANVVGNSTGMVTTQLDSEALPR